MLLSFFFLFRLDTDELDLEDSRSSFYLMEARVSVSCIDTSNMATRLFLLYFYPRMVHVLAYHGNSSTALAVFSLQARAHMFVCLCVRMACSGVQNYTDSYFEIVPHSSLVYLGVVVFGFLSVYATEVIYVCCLLLCCFVLA